MKDFFFFFLSCFFLMTACNACNCPKEEEAGVLVMGGASIMQESRAPSRNLYCVLQNNLTLPSTCSAFLCSFVSLCLSLGPFTDFR